MKKTIIALMAFSGVALAEETTYTAQYWDFGGSNVPTTDTTTYTLAAGNYSAEVKNLGDSATKLNHGAWNVQAEETAADYLKNIGGEGAEAIAGFQDAYINAGFSFFNLMSAPYTYICGDGVWASIGVTLSGLEAGATYTMAVMTGLPKAAGGTWNSLTLDENNTFATTSKEIGVQNIAVANTVTGYVINDVVADTDGCISFTINANGAHYAAINHVALIQTGSAPIPEPTTATLSLLALAGLAARRRRR